jgi:hypothetical protein
LIAAVAALAYLWVGWCAFPASNWNELRLAPTFALLHGISIYPPLDGGPLTTWIYGPVGLLVNAPVILAPNATLAIEIAGVMNLFTLIAPLAVICFGLRDAAPRPKAESLLLLTLAILLLPANSLQFQVADHTAIALGLLSCFLLASSDGERALVPAALAALAIWSKQTAVYLPLAQAVWLLLSGKRSAALRLFGWTLLFALALGAVFGALWGFRELWLNLVEVPARLPWGDIADKLTRRAPQLALQFGLPSAGLIALWRSGRWPARDTASGRFLGLAIAVAIASLLVGLPSFFKVGGDLNALHAWFYLVPALLLAGRPSLWPRWLPAAAVAAVVLARVPEFRTLPTRPQTAALIQAEAIAGANAGAVWFPYNPLVTFYSDHRFYHVEDGIATRSLAGLGLRQATFRRHLPPQLSGVIYPGSQTEFFALQLLPEFSTRTRSGEWTVFTPAPK